MATKIKWSEERIRKLEAEGRGKGLGATYTPWILVTDFSSLGNSRRVFSYKTGRIHHFMSDVEWQFFLLLEFSDDIIDIREQYPLKREDTQSIAAERRIKHPRYPGTSVPTVMTCDFLVTRQRNAVKSLEAYDCKRTEEAENPRSLEKLEIHRVYFNESDTPHHLVLHSMLPKSKVKNLEWIRSAHVKEGEVEEYPAYFEQHCQRMIVELGKATRNQPLSDFCENYDIRSGAMQGTGLRAVRILLSQKALITDLNEPNLAAAPVGMFRAAAKRGLRALGGV